MAHKRIIDPRIFKDEILISLSQKQALLYLLLWNYVENNGCGKASAKSIKADVLPFLNYSRRFVAETINKLAELNLIVLYCYDDQAYFYICNFNEYQNYKTVMPSRVRSPGNFPRLSSIDVETENGLPNGKRRKKYTRKTSLSDAKTQTPPAAQTIISDSFTPENDSEKTKPTSETIKNNNIYNNINNNINNISYTAENGVENDRCNTKNVAEKTVCEAKNESFPQPNSTAKAPPDNIAFRTNYVASTASNKFLSSPNNSYFNSHKPSKSYCASPNSSSSFDTDEFFRLALKRSYSLNQSCPDSTSDSENKERKKDK